MARPPRIDLPNGLYHVTSRGNGRAAIFWSDADQERFLSQLADNVQTAAVVLYAYVLLDNHWLCEASHNTCYVKFGIM
ncbi:MAG: hypothetical protein WC869_16920 [Phycisphaerae bacterium]